MVAPIINGRLIGYARVTVDDQDLSLQIDSLTGLGINPDDNFTEKISGAKTDRPQLDACLAKLQQGPPADQARGSESSACETAAR